MIRPTVLLLLAVALLAGCFTPAQKAQPRHPNPIPQTVAPAQQNVVPPAQQKSGLSITTRPGPNESSDAQAKRRATTDAANKSWDLPKVQPDSVRTAPEDGEDRVHVRGYTRKDGTYVRPHTRSRP